MALKELPALTAPADSRVVKILCHQVEFLKHRTCTPEGLFSYVKLKNKAKHSTFLNAWAIETVQGKIY